MDRKSDGATSRMNLKTFRNHFPDLVELAEQWKIDLPKIVVIGKRNDSRVKNLIQDLFGLSICLKGINNPIVYRFINDETCEDDQVLCSVNDALVEFDLLTESESLKDRLAELNDLRDDLEPTAPLVELNIRANSVDSIEFVDLHFLSFDCAKYWLVRCLPRENYQPVVAIDVGIGAGDLIPHYPSYTRVSLDNSSVGLSQCIPKIRNAIIKSTLHSVTFKKVRYEFQGRLADLDGPIPKTDNRKRRILSSMFEGFKETIEDRFQFSSVCSDTVADLMNSPHREAKHCPMVHETSKTIDGIMMRLGGICEKSAEEYFSRFPAIGLELKKISNTLLETMVNPPLKRAFEYVSKSHFMLAHEFLCDDDDDDACGYVCLIEAFMGPVIDRMRCDLVAQVEFQLFSWVHLLEESEAITKERDLLRKKMKLMHNVYASMKESDDKSESN
jgi:hypothetical protein